MVADHGGDVAKVLVLRNCFSNLGDKAMLECEVAELLKRWPGSRLTVATDEPERLSRELPVKTIESDISLARPGGAGRGVGFLAPAWRALSSVLLKRNIHHFDCSAADRLPPGARTLLAELRSCGAVVAGGGLMPSHPALYAARRAFLRKARELGKPVLLHGQTVFDRNRADSAVLLASRLVVRDRHFSRQHAISCGMAPEKILNGLDPAWGQPRERCQADLPEKFTAVSVRPPLGAKAAQLLAQAEMEAPVVIFGMQDYWGLDDADAIRQFTAAYRRPLTFLRGISAGAARDVLARAERVLACRYHAALFALLEGKPTAMLAASAEYDVKLRGAARMFGSEDSIDRPMAMFKSDPVHCKDILLERARRLELESDDWLNALSGLMQSGSADV